ncbi:MAG: hypothetical protein AB1894_09645 [Chloroflexota bacterium]
MKRNQIPATLFLLFLTIFSSSAYVYASHAYYQIGFPLDDAWIHQTYARNLAWLGEWAFLPGKPSAGSTAPLWSSLLAVGYWFRLNPYLFTYLLGGLALFGVALIGGRIFAGYFPGRSKQSMWVSVFLVLEWHLVWAAASGMETLLMAFLILWVMLEVVRPSPRSLILGILIGLSMWVRPDGITLLGPAAIAVLISRRSWRERLWGLARLCLGILACLLPYVLFNVWLDGSVWPNTFFAKQAEYAIVRQSPLWKRLAAQTGLLLVGAGALLVPGLVVFMQQAIRQRSWIWLTLPVWLGGYLGLYAWRLPVTYQHGRYVIPSMPVYFVCGLAGMAVWMHSSRTSMWRRVFGKTWLMSCALILGLFWLQGAWAYARDVGVIESEMVAVARWVNANTQKKALIAAHDIGALGYFGGRDILDLAGLVSPEVIPFIRDESRLKQFLDEQGADYLVAFPGWYPELVKFGRLEFSSQGLFSPGMGGENMCVYAWFAP